MIYFILGMSIAVLALVQFAPIVIPAFIFIALIKALWPREIH